mmetsp:Transcript_15018/g.23680  ORF Transcript_15018/g.23680 Transcript_15018/m.23680 type:complete len:200 (+) Transcript_15018:893-1492(+)
MSFPRGKMLVLGDAGIGNVPIPVIHHRTALIITVIMDKPLKIQRAVSQSPQLLAKIPIQRSRPDHVIRPRRLLRRIGGVQMHIDCRMVQDRRHHRCIARFRHALKTMRKVIVFVIEPQRQPFQDRGRQFRGGTAPLLFGVAFKKGLIQIPPDKPQRLFFKALRIRDGGVCLRLFNEAPGLLRTKAAAKELVDGVQVHRQ